MDPVRNSGSGSRVADCRVEFRLVARGRRNGLVTMFINGCIGPCNSYSTNRGLGARLSVTCGCEGGLSVEISSRPVPIKSALRGSKLTLPSCAVHLDLVNCSSSPVSESITRILDKEEVTS